GGGGAGRGRAPGEPGWRAGRGRAGRRRRVGEGAAELTAGRDAALAYTTVMTVMPRLAGKGILVRSRSGRRFVYARVAADTAEIAVRGVLAEFGDAALARFVERAELDPQLRGRLPRLME